MLVLATTLLTAAWQAPLLVTQRAAVTPAAATVRMSFMSKVKEINEANKMPMVTRTAPKVRAQRLPPDVLEITTKFKKEYPCVPHPMRTLQLAAHTCQLVERHCHMSWPLVVRRKKELELLWGALLKSYGTAELAKAAVVSNPQIINPSYTFCNTMLISKQARTPALGTTAQHREACRQHHRRPVDALTGVRPAQVLVDMMGEEDALDVMVRRPHAALRTAPRAASRTAPWRAAHAHFSASRLGGRHPHVVTPAARQTKNPAVLQCGPSLDTLGPDEIKGFANIRNLGNNLFPQEVPHHAIPNPRAVMEP